MPNQSKRPRLLFVTMGGTIASTSAPGQPGAVPKLDGAALMASVSDLERAAEIEVENFRQLPSASFAVADVVALAAMLNQRLARDRTGSAGFDGVVVAQGTDTIEETAFLLDLLVDSETPVVVTGAMRTPDQPGSDGPANLLAAVRVATASAARGLGALVVLNDEIHAGRFVQKRSTSLPSAFASPLTGRIGFVAEDRPRILLAPRGRLRLPCPDPETVPLPVIIHVGVGDEDRPWRWLLADSGLPGVIVEAMGAGHVPEGAVSALEDLADRLPVVLVSRSGPGEVLRATYGFPGSESDLLARGLINGGSLDAHKARLLLALLLANDAPKAAIVAAFDALADGQDWTL